MTKHFLLIRGARVGLVQTTMLLLLGLVPVPVGLDWASSMRESARSPRMNRVDRERTAGGYYQGLIGVDGVECVAARPSSATTRPFAAVPFTQANVSKRVERDFLLLELLPNISKPLYGNTFTTNSHGMRDRPYDLEKPEGTFRIAVLGSSIDMGWGVGTEETYVNLLEDWLNDEAARLGSPRRFQVLNFAVAAYGPMQRLETFRRKATAFQPDMVLYSATMLDLRLLEIHLCDMLQNRVDLRYDYLRKAVAHAGVTEADLRIDAKGALVEKDRLKAKLRTSYWAIYEATVGVLQADCRSLGIPMACLIVPRVGQADAPGARGPIAGRLREVLGRHADAVFDLSNTFDATDPAEFEISNDDDHPNAAGHRRIFQGLSKSLVQSELRDALFPTSSPVTPPPTTVAAE